MTAGAAEMASEEIATYAVRCADLTYRLGTHTAVDHVDLNIAPGEMFGDPPARTRPGAGERSPAAGA